MTPTILESESNSTSFMFQSVYWPEESAYRCHIGLIPEEDGTWSAVVLNLPGGGSCGRSEDEAISNVREAIVGLVESYRSDGKEIPWKDSMPSDISECAKNTWILVNA
jgi:predicted RNase H-like HicB family nuclease